MTVDELIEALESIKRQNPKRPIGDYLVLNEDGEHLETVVEHSLNVVSMMMEIE